MMTLSKKEKILFGLMAFSILFGAYELFRPAPSKNRTTSNGAGTEQMLAFIHEVSSSVIESAPSELEGHIISRVETEWDHDPFAVTGSNYRTGTPRQGYEPPQKEFLYSGYMSAKGKKIAIINGTEYVAGEPLGERYVLKDIFPSKVIIVDIVWKKRIVVLLKE